MFQCFNVSIHSGRTLFCYFLFSWLSVLLICRNIVHYPVFLWLYGCFSLCFRLYVCAYWCIGVYIPMVILYVNDIIFLYWFLLVSLPLFCFYFWHGFFIKNRNSVISVNSSKMCPIRYCRRDFCTKITGTRCLCLLIPCTCYQIVFINYCIVFVFFDWLIGEFRQYTNIIYG